MNCKTRVHDWESILVVEETPLSHALDIMTQAGLQLLLVCDGNKKLVGMLTDSDVRKALLRGLIVNETVSLVMNKSPLVVSPGLGEDDANQLMILNHIFHLPVVDDSGMIVGLHVAEQLRSIELYEEVIVIMAGGRGQRLMPLTSDVPKPMLPIKGKPMLEHIILRAKREGFCKFVISVNYLAEKIISHFGDGSAYGVSIEYIHEEIPLGTAGSLAQLRPDYRKNQIVVTNADVLTSFAFADLVSHAKSCRCDGIMAVRWHEMQCSFGVVLCDGNRFKGIKEKPLMRSQVNAGIYVISSALLELLENGRYCDMPDLFVRGHASGMELEVFPLHEYWLDIGRHEDYLLAL